MLLALLAVVDLIVVVVGLIVVVFGLLAVVVGLLAVVVVLVLFDMSSCYSIVVFVKFYVSRGWDHNSDPHWLYSLLVSR